MTEEFDEFKEINERNKFENPKFSPTMLKALVDDPYRYFVKEISGRVWICESIKAVDQNWITVNLHSDDPECKEYDRGLDLKIDHIVFVADSPS